MSVGFGPEVRLAVVVDLRGEPQQASVRVGRRLAGGGRQAVLLVSTLQHEHGSVLHVGGLLHHLRVENQVRSRCEQKQSRVYKQRRRKVALEKSEIKLS